MKGRLASNLLVSIVSFLLGSGFAYAAFTAYRVHRIWKAEIASAGRGWEGKVHRFDPELGFSPVPDSRGAHLFPIGPKIPMRYDGDGFRIPVSGQERKRPFLLALGCSFTYGDACAAEDAYPHLLAEILGGTELNAGVCSYGLTQMVLLAERLIPQLRPEFVTVEYSTLIADRALNYFAPSYFLSLPVPYFRNDGTGKLAIAPPVFRTVLFDWEPSEFRTQGGYFHFLGKAGVPLLWQNDRAYLGFLRERVLGDIPKPAKDRDAVLRFVYGRIAELARQNGSRMVVVGVSFNSRPLEIPSAVESPGIPVVNAHQAVLATLKPLEEERYAKTYAHFRGDPPRLVDPHPNPAAHRLIAQAVAARLQAEAGTPPKAPELLLNRP